jgi:hypothetical protein
MNWIKRLDYRERQKSKYRQTIEAKRRLLERAKKLNLLPPDGIALLEEEIRKMEN